MTDKLNTTTATNTALINTRTRKIGTTTFIVSTSINTEKKRDIEDIVSRLIELNEVA
jgi:hypothetical protein